MRRPENRARLAPLSMMAWLAAMPAYAMEFGSFDARSAALGNTGVASNGLVNGGFHNPALLTTQEEKEDFSLLLPVVGLRIADPSSLVDDIDAFTSASDAGNVAGMTAALTAANGKAILANVYAGIAMSFAGDRHAGGLLANGYTLNSVRVNPDFGTPANSTLSFLGVDVVEVGFPLATRLNLGLRSLAVGVTPKYVQVRTNDFTRPLSTFQTDSDGFLDDPANQTEDAGFNLDAGIAHGMGHGLRTAIVVRNLLSQAYVTATGRSIEIKPQLRAGVAWTNEWVSVSLDADLTKNDPVGFEGQSQVVALGAEFDAFNFLQLRIGYLNNLAAAANIGEPAAYSAGLGLNLFGLHIDVAAISNLNDNDLGVFGQLGLNF